MFRDTDTGGTEREGTSKGASDRAKDAVWCIKGNAIGRDTRQNGGFVRKDVTYTLDATDRHGVCATGMCAAFKLGNSEKARSIGYSVECAPTLNAECGGNKPAIFDMTHACDVIRDCCQIVPTLQSRMGTGGNQVPLVLNDQGGSVISVSNGIVGTLRAQEHGHHPIIMSIGNGQLHELQNHSNVCRTLNCMHDQQAILIGKLIRRLTPLECERLQGFPDGWTDIGDYIDSNGRKRKTSDSARYKALGNSIAIPPWTWVLSRICGNYDRPATMASLFDGIGGFPLIWERINGEGSCLWASEIEEFPIAVTRKRFGGDA